MINYINRSYIQIEINRKSKHCIKSMIHSKGNNMRYIWEEYMYLDQLISDQMMVEYYNKCNVINIK